jgi:hypothetical protein
MTAERTTCDDFIIDLAQSVPPLHPQACIAVNGLLNEAHRASHAGQTRRVVHLMTTIKTQVAVALHKEGIAAAAFGDDLTAGALHQYAAAFDPDAWRVFGDDPAVIQAPRAVRALPRPGSAEPLSPESHHGAPYALLEPPPQASNDRTLQPGEDPMSEQPRAANVPPVTSYFDEKAPAPAAMIAHVVDQMQTATPERMARAHQRVTIHNTAQQVFYVQDRSLRHIEFRPGEKKEIDMIADELQYLIYQSRTDRGYYESGPKKGEPLPPHPLKVIGMQPQQDAALIR